MDKRLFALFPVCILALAVTGTGCARLSARSTPEPPPLDVPAPPPRVVETAETDAPGPGPLVDAPGGSSPSSAAKPVRPPTRPDPAKAEPQKPEPTAPAAVEAQPAAPQESPRPPATTLQTAPPERDAALEKEIRDLLYRATANLNRVDYRRLNADARSQYDQAKRFAEQAEENVREKNLLFALNLADKAATLATQLAGR